MEELIMRRARELFFSYGIRSVSMDDISQEAAISKKTVYKFFKDKNQVIERLVGELLADMSALLHQCKSYANNPIEEVVLFSRLPMELITTISPGFFFELKKFFPEIWKSVEAYNKDVLVPFIERNLQEGIELDLYRADIDISFTADVRMRQIISVPEVKTFTDRLVQTTRLMMQLTEFYLHAIATPKGKLIIKYLNEYNERQFSN